MCDCCFFSIRVILEGTQADYFFVPGIFRVATISERIFGARGAPVEISCNTETVNEQKNRKQRQNEITRLRNWKISPRAVFYVHGSMKTDKEPIFREKSHFVNGG